MSRLWGTRIAAAIRSPVQVSGDWTTDEVRPGEIRRWQGVASGAEELVAVLIADHFGSIGWSRSRRSRPAGLDLALQVYLPDRTDFRPWVLMEAGGAQLLWQAPWPGGTGIELLVKTEIETGRLVRWARTIGRIDPALFGFVLLAKQDARFGRKRIWKARAGIGPADGALREALRGPRWGWDPAQR
jgi:hypothetical protein